MRVPRWSVLAGACVLFAGVAACCIAAQEAAPPVPAHGTGSSSSASKPKNQKYSHANDFLIIGTVFTERGMAFPGVQLRIRRSSEKKFRWDTYTNSRGDFAVRVPQGTDYEMVVHEKGFADQTRAVDAKSGLGEMRVVFRMEPEKDAKR